LEVKKDILWRVYLIYFIICLFGVAIISKVCIIQFSEGEMWKARAQSASTRVVEIEAVRGNIYDVNGSLLATSLPYYEVAMDVYTEALTQKIFEKDVDSLAWNLANLFKDKSSREYKKMLVKARRDKDRWLVLHRNVSYPDLQKMKKFPILCKGKNKGGFIYLQTNKRERPFQFLAARTIGKINENGGKSYGLESAFDSILVGTTGERTMQKIAGGVWRPINSDNEIDPQDGSDILSTIDINVQDVAENSLMNCLRKHGADHGCLVLMEVKTGEVKAIANLTRDKKDSAVYLENLNYAVAIATAPGSTFKLPSLVAAMEDYDVKLDEIVDIGDGTCYYSGEKVSDSHHPEKPKVTVQEIFEHSSNVGVTKLITRYYSKDPQKYIDRLYKMNMGTPLGISIPGEATPYIKDTHDKSWSKISLQWISYGYESRVSPLQILTFYNAIANGGQMVKPMFVKEIRKRGKTLKSFSPEIINPSICSKKTVEKARTMMEGVVLRGTGIDLKASNYHIAGKTGTAQMGIVNGKMTYQASFVGYFPADNPKYSCIVVISAPTGDAYYGGAVAGPVFRDVADKVYSTSLEIHKEINAAVPAYAKKAPAAKNGSREDLEKVLGTLKIKKRASGDESEWIAVTKTDSATISLSVKDPDALLKKGIVPDLTGMSARDAIYLLENKGIRVKITGSGAVAKQSLAAGSPFVRGTQIVLQLI
jgi:cell division protein FtsI (penicillin-binding protein 3)